MNHQKCYNYISPGLQVSLERIKKVQTEKYLNESYLDLIDFEFVIFAKKATTIVTFQGEWVVGWMYG